MGEDPRTRKKVFHNWAMNLTAGGLVVRVSRVIVSVLYRVGVAEKIVAERDPAAVCPRSKRAGNDHQHTAGRDDEPAHDCA